jgi:hypothetical protein
MSRQASQGWQGFRGLLEVGKKEYKTLAEREAILAGWRRGEEHPNLPAAGGAWPEEADVRKPNLFIVGAPRRGTTWLWSSLKEHPVCMGSIELKG